jgi:crossover junction endodeoxyribonuclease RuvC
MPTATVDITERILGVDPGFGRMGYGIIEKTPTSWKLVTYGCVETPPKSRFLDRLATLHKELTTLITTHAPTRMAVEELFFFKNVKTAMDVGQARGVILLTAVENGLPVDEFTPLQVKQAITGYGRAEKDQLERMVGIVLGLTKKITPDDAADALAIALTAGQTLWLSKLK